ncbi:DeoR/GlpR transcriptional regulator [Brenneria goodwinii]|uniref:DeoR/GlpR family DNA-binding transcription regulator n=2 Tax=Brenneria goodwinii TaxID=1109412 RepID=UPI000EF23BEE|nr:DeoR/GlpR family DNA-binding transcription regulator [Brenneria goodwinii]MCG8156753.1 DeoR/GlpR transcriptional regulator [Brenneria goodwinii]MCG8160233.1 DeoR/GlpR transcriptional regulator [Brenneria goodwinii]MCG8164756.1 DeoR/GlpR transcriptional regulator [Brenneria goodwinii]MCG8171586.1 DeoR/GlpR transcriptional regulator [Brenneria goodwinii]MCG8174066.1 DeoR/GlpR transcriptional regulator [Brenneria goodwinii]
MIDYHGGQKGKSGPKPRGLHAIEYLQRTGIRNIGMSLSSAQERRNHLAEVLITEGSVRVGVLAERFNVSTETIRKDLIELEKQGIVKKNHGRAIPISNFLDIERPFDKKNNENTEIKNKLAQAALELVPESGVVVLDTGSTVYSLARLLALKKNLKIFTNSLTSAQILASSSNDVYLLGGKLRSTSMGAVGTWGVSGINSIRADVAFLGTDGFSGTTGPCTVSYEEAELKKAMVDCAKVRVVVSDSTKFDIAGLFKFSEWSELDHLVTDNRAPAPALQRLEEFLNIIQVAV